MWPERRRCTCGLRDRDGAPVGCWHEDIEWEHPDTPQAPPLRKLEDITQTTGDTP